MRQPGCAWTFIQPSIVKNGTIQNTTQNASDSTSSAKHFSQKSCKKSPLQQNCNPAYTEEAIFYECLLQDWCEQNKIKVYQASGLATYFLLFIRSTNPECVRQTLGAWHTHKPTHAHTHTNIRTQYSHLPKYGGRRIQASRCHHMTAFCSFGFMGKVLHKWSWLIVAREVLGVEVDEDMAADSLQFQHPFRSKQSQECIPSWNAAKI